MIHPRVFSFSSLFADNIKKLIEYECLGDEPTSGESYHLFRLINFSILGHGFCFLKICISVLLPEATFVLGFKIVSPVRNLIVNRSIITLFILFL